MKNTASLCMLKHTRGFVFQVQAERAQWRRDKNLTSSLKWQTSDTAEAGVLTIHDSLLVCENAA